MQLLCSHCDKQVEYSSDRPRFCSHCGGALHSTIGADEPTLDVTLDATPGSTPNRLTSGPMAESRPSPNTVGGYRLHGELGRGGMGTVYEAEEEETGRRVALKLLAPQASTTDDGVERFLQEGRYAASLSHPRSTFVYAAGEDQGRLFIVMELMSGGTLKELVDESGPLPVSQAVDFILDVIDGLQSAHSKDLIHRDLKPSNCFVDKSGRAKVGDFGLSKSLVADAGLTRTGAFMGTPMFAAPEQVKSQAVTVQTDVYAVGATLYHLLTGQGPYEGDAAKVIAAIVSESPPSMRSHRAEIPIGLDRAVAWAMEKDVVKRPENLADLRERLEPFSGRETSFVDLSRRLAAFSIDGFVVAILTTVCVLPLAIPASFTFKTPTADDPGMLPIFLAFASAAIGIGYFAFAEWKWGKAVGKYTMGLRVTNVDGAAPRLIQTTIRAAILPGLQMFFGTILPLLLNEASKLPANIEDPIARAVWTLRSQIYPIMGWVTLLACMVTMRRGNGLMGIHEILSRTCVRRDKRGASSHYKAAIRVACLVDDMPVTIGPFKILGDLGKCENGRLWLARDEGLERTVWIAVSADSTGPSPQRRSLDRATRLRWLRGGELAHGELRNDSCDPKSGDDHPGVMRWDAYEAFEGGAIFDFRKSAWAVLPRAGASCNGVGRGGPGRHHAQTTHRRPDLDRREGNRKTTGLGRPTGGRLTGGSAP
jgi:serine/threonine protein kinase